MTTTQTVGYEVLPISPSSVRKSSASIWPTASTMQWWQRDRGLGPSSRPLWANLGLVDAEGVERADGLVHQKHHRVRCQSPCQSDAFARDARYLQGKSWRRVRRTS
jgi:hypothetical protein